MNGVGFAFRLISGGKKEPPFSHTQGNGNGKGSFSFSSPFMHLERERETRRRRSSRRRKWRRIRRIDLSKFIAHTVCSDKLCLKRKKIAVFCNSFVESYTSTPPSFSSLRDKRRGKGEEEKPPPFAVKANAQKRERGLRQKRGKLYVQCSYRVYR